MDRKDHIDAFGAVVLVGFSALLGLNQVLVKLVSLGMAPAFQSGLRSACAFFPVLIFALIMRRKLTVMDGSLIPGLFTGTLFAAEFLLLFQALEYTSVGHASIMFYTMPFWVALGAHFLIPGEQLTLVRIIGLALSVVGVSIALLKSGNAGGSAPLLGDIMCLIAAIGWAAIALIARTTNFSKAVPEMQLLYQLAISAPILLGFAFLSGETFRELTNTHLWIFAFQVFGVVSVGFLTWFWILSIYPASDMASFGFLAPVFGVIFGWLVFDEALTVEVIGSLVLVGIGIVLVNQKRKAKP